MFHNFLFNKSKFCNPKCFIRDFLVKEARGGGLMGHFRTNMLHGHFFWPKMKHDVHKFIASVLNTKELNLDHN